MTNLAAVLTNGHGAAPLDRPQSAAELLAQKIESKAEAFRWAELAAAGGHTKASILLGDFFRDGAYGFQACVSGRCPASLLMQVADTALRWHCNVAIVAGVGVTPDAESAAWMYRKVAERAPSLGLVLRQALEWQMLSTGPTEISQGAAEETIEDAISSNHWLENGEGEWERAVMLYRIGALMPPSALLCS